VAVFGKSLVFDEAWARHVHNIDKFIHRTMTKLVKHYDDFACLMYGYMYPAFSLAVRNSLRG
jgi:hypothetical protein